MKKPPRIELVGKGKYKDSVAAYNWHLYIDGEEVTSVKSVNFNVVAGELSTLDITLRGADVKIKGPVVADFRYSEEEEGVKPDDSSHD